MKKTDQNLKEYDICPRIDVNYNREVLYYEDIKVFLKKFKDDFKNSNCVACSSKLHYHLMEKDGFDYRKCTECETVYISPRPEPEALKWWYSKSRQIKHSAKILEKTKDKRLLIYKDRVEKILSRINGNIKTVLEIGCSSGIFLDFFRSVKPEFKFAGIDASKDAIKIAREKKLNCKNISIEEFAKKTNTKYDLILAFEVLEHLNNPLNTLKFIYRLLSRESFLYFTVPNYLAYDFLEIGDIYRNLAGPAHLNYFNPYSIKKLLKRAGFKGIRVFCDGILDTSIVQNYHSEKKKVQYGFWKYIYDNKDRYSEFLKEFQSLLQKYILSGNMTVIAKK